MAGKRHKILNHIARGSLHFYIRSEIKVGLYVFHLNTNKKRKTGNGKQRNEKLSQSKGKSVHQYSQHISYMYLHIQLINHGEKHGRQYITNNDVSERSHNTHLFSVYAEQ